MSENGTGFDAGKRIKQINVGSRERPVWVDYMHVQDRVLWARTDCPEMDLRTEMLPALGDLVVVRATVTRPGGGVATGHGSSRLAVPDAVEKAETTAVGRALAYLGYGTAAALADEGHVCDSPVERPAAATTPKPTAAATSPRPTAAATTPRPTAAPECNGGTQQPAADLIPTDPGEAVAWFRARVAAMPQPVSMTVLARQQVAKAVAISARKAGIPDAARAVAYQRLTGKESGLEMEPRELQLLAEVVVSRPEALLAIAGVDPEALLAVAGVDPEAATAAARAKGARR